MVAISLRDQDRLDGDSNFGVWKAKMSFLLDEYGLKEYAKNVIVVLKDPQQWATYIKENSKMKRMILDGFKGYIVLHIARKAQ